MARYHSAFTGEEIDGRVGAIAAAFDSERSYAIGEFAYYNGAVYQRIKNPGSGGWVEADWALTMLSDAIYAGRKRMDNTELLHLLLGGGVSKRQMEAALAVKADKVSGAVAGNLAALDGTGNLLDSGLKPADFGSAKDVEILYKLAKGQIYDTETDTQEAYVKTVPSGAVAAEIGSIGGKTVVWNQKVYNANFAEASGWTAVRGSIAYGESALTLTCNEDGNVSAYGSTGYTSAFPAHKYYVFGDVEVSRGGSYRVAIGTTITSDYMSVSLTADTPTHIEGLITLAEEKTTSVRFGSTGVLSVGDTITLHGLYCVDVTQMFGAGNEPTDTSDPRIAAIEAYAVLHPGFNVGSLLSAAVTSIKIVGKNLFDKSLCTHGMLELDGTETMTPSYVISDYIPCIPNTDYYFGVMNSSRAVFYYANKSPIVEDSWNYGSTAKKVTSPSKAYFFRVTVDNACVDDLQIELGSTATSYAPYMEDEFEIPAAVRALEGYGQSEVGGSGNTLNLSDGTYTEIGHYVDGVWTALETPVVTDVSGMLPDNMLDTEAGGTLTFMQEGIAPYMDVEKRVTYTSGYGTPVALPAGTKANYGHKMYFYARAMSDTGVVPQGIEIQRSNSSGTGFTFWLGGNTNADGSVQQLWNGNYDYENMEYVSDGTTTVGTRKIRLSVSGPVLGTELPITYNLSSVRLIDLTEVFGKGQEPVSLDDARLSALVGTTEFPIPNSVDYLIKLSEVETE